MDRCVAAAIAEDVGAGDITSRHSIPAGLEAEARIAAKSEGVLAGNSLAATVLRAVDSRIRIVFLRPDGARLRRGQPVLVARGPARSLLTAERTALNFLQHLSGIATQTARVVRSVRRTGARVLATRKTTPGLRALQKYAVQVGGGSPHRQGLFDAVLLKENHIDLSGIGPAKLMQKMRSRLGRKISLGAEARTLEEARSLHEGGADWILLDNMKPPVLRKAVRSLRALGRKTGRSLELEASGGIDARNAKNYALTGVDRISLGSLTHSAPAIDFSMDFRPVPSARSRARRHS